MEKQILELAKKILAETELHSVLHNAMDQLIQLSGAERDDCFIRSKIARNLKSEDIDNPEFEVSRTIIDEVKAVGKPICLANAFIWSQFRTIVR
jgi:hypothetical protein